MDVSGNKTKRRNVKEREGKGRSAGIEQIFASLVIAGGKS
jgi:hypothetical protein